MKSSKLNSSGVLFVMVVLFFIPNITPAYTSDWPQWRGPNRDGKSNETGLLKMWPKEGPDLLWTIENIGRRHGSVAIKNNTIYVNGMIDRTDYLFAIDVKGKIKWKIPFGLGWKQAEPGVRTTPTVA